MKNANKVILLCMLFYIQSIADEFVYNGVYSVAQILSSSCDNCLFDVPAEFMEEKVICNFSGKSSEDVYKYVQSAMNGRGWRVTKTKNKITARQKEEQTQAAFIDHAGNVQIVDSKFLNLYKLADSIQTKIKDSLVYMEKYKQDSLHNVVQDSLNNVKQKPLRKFELHFVQMDKNFCRRMGATWPELLANGNLRGKLKLFDDWEIKALELNDTSFIRRKVTLSLDSVGVVSWGNETQELERTYTENGIITQDYKYRQYGITATLYVLDSTYKLEYVVRNNDDLHTNFTGTTKGLFTDTLELTGELQKHVTRVSGLPFLSSVPVVGNLFKSENVELVQSVYFVYALPAKVNANSQTK